ncbi:ABC transporter ATP-binding protein [Shewanella intestini]|uniref:ATP-binding cassette domain-containing protein n=1 Tax=Shewanella intestini TaxID=2017544 RepID=A0ABS5I4R0_9GAMM|nr:MULTISPECIES: ABC transporter transmembrane domain-containing protein [Shewanella]MBR9729015.1 ATP-binding cassette domain-containing protein [Shewanella intestini]MRG36919.1 ATP-binding cassette domain-containing protein [Shewanella sp. XMDDZSB0408]
MNILWKLKRYILMFKRHYLIAIVALQVVALINLVPSWLIGKIVDGISDDTLNGQMLFIHVMGIVLAGFAMYGLRFVWQSQLYGASVAITKVIRSDLFEKFSRLTPTFFARLSTGDLMAHATNDLNAVEETMGMGIMTLVDSVIAGLTVIAGMVFVVSGQLTAIALLPFPLLVIVTRRYGKKLHQAFSRAQGAFSQLTEEARETVSGIRAVRSHGIAHRQQQRFNQSIDDTVDANLAVAKVDAAFAPTIQLVYGLSFVISLGYGAWLIEQGVITVGLFTTFTLYLGQLLGPFLQFGWQFNVFQRGNTSWQRLEKLFAEQIDVTEGKQTLPATTAANMTFDIKRFCYPHANHAALSAIKFDLPTGGLVGISGPTGSGKSTLLQLALRQFQLDAQSNIYLGGVTIDSLTFESLRSKLAWVPQKPHLFSGSIADNIGLGNPNASREEIVHVAEMAGIKDEIEAMEAGFDTQMREGGSNLSGGQRQRVTLARALLTQADILLLDDPFSALDMKTEVIVRKNLKAHYGHKTILLVTQRLTNLIEADHILILHEGEVTERGNHHQLMANNDWYATVYQRQSQLGQTIGTSQSQPVVPHDLVDERTVSEDVAQLHTHAQRKNNAKRDKDAEVKITHELEDKS